MDRAGQTIDFLLIVPRDREAALRFLKKAIARHGVPETVTIDRSEANAAAIRSDHAEHGTVIVIRQVKYFNNIVEQAHRGVKRIIRPMQGFNACDAALCTLAGVERMHMLWKGHLERGVKAGSTPAEQFYALAASFPAR